MYLYIHINSTKSNIYIYIYIYTAYEQAAIARTAPNPYLLIITFNLGPSYLLLFIKKRNSDVKKGLGVCNRTTCEMPGVRLNVFKIQFLHDRNHTVSQLQTKTR